MLNLYSVDRKTKDLDEENRQREHNQRWESWKRRNCAGWMQNYRHRLEKFVSDVDANPQEYDALFKREEERPFDHLRRYPCPAGFLGPARFSFNTYKTEKERIEVPTFL